MKKKSLALLLLVVLVVSVLAFQPNELSEANDAWFSGKYSVALQTYLRLLKGSNGEQYLEPIAIQTGELYHSDELTTDARNQRLSTDGRLIVYETGALKTPTIRVVAATNTNKFLAEFPGTGAVLSPSGKRIAYLKLKPNEELDQAYATLDKAQGVARFAAQQTVNYLQAKHAIITLRDLATQQERELDTTGLLKTTLAFGVEDETVYFVGGRDGDTRRNDIYAVTVSSQPTVVTDADGFKAAPIVAASGKAMLVALFSSNPMPRAPSQPATSGQGTGQGGGQGFGNQPIGRFGIVDLATKKMQVVNGQFPALSADGSEVAYLTRNQQDIHLMVLPVPGGTETSVFKTTDLLQSPSFSPDGQKLIYSRRSKDDYETFIIGRDGKNELRVTREIQHNALPRFLSAHRVLDVIGEPRHRRAWVYDLQTGQKHQLFHNNTVRTISPEYDWQISRDGSKVLILADRDGDTVSPERGLYLVHLDRKVTKEELIARLEKTLPQNLLCRTRENASSRRLRAMCNASCRRLRSIASMNMKSRFTISIPNISRDRAIKRQLNICTKLTNRSAMNQ